jgi:hypothetical protein
MIFTEIVGVAEIGEVMLKSYLKYHMDPICVYCSEEDRDYLSKNIDSAIVEYRIVNDDVLNAYKQGHLGTAKIYADIFLDSIIEDIIHIDSDVVFKKESISLIKNRLAEGYALVGPIRRYKENPNNRPDCEYRENVVSTFFFGFKKSYVTKRSKDLLTSMVVGNSIDGQPIIDFFDPVSFDILQNGGKIYHLSRQKVGGFSETGSDSNIGNFLNCDLEYGENMIHFAGIGSGFRKFRGNAPYMSEGYSLWAVERYKMFSNLFNIENKIFTLSPPKEELYNKLIENDNVIKGYKGSLSVK